MPDDLGSPRQSADAAGAISHGQSFASYGDPLDAAGEQASNHGFAGEWTDPSGLVYLRARYYSPSEGRFIAKDEWEGDFFRPSSLNEWNYVENNPTNWSDPTGYGPFDYYVKLMKQCYEKGNYDCLWRYYSILGNVAKSIGYPFAGRHIVNFLNKGGDIKYYPGNPSTASIFSSQSVRNALPNIEAHLFRLVHNQGRGGLLTGFVRTNAQNIIADSSLSDEDRDLYYGFGTFGIALRAQYRIVNCNNVVIGRRTYFLNDYYDWHIGLPAGGVAQGISSIEDAWAHKLEELGKAKSYAISGYWNDNTEKTYVFPNDWLDKKNPSKPLFSY